MPGKSNQTAIFAFTGLADPNPKIDRCLAHRPVPDWGWRSQSALRAGLWIEIVFVALRVKRFVSAGISCDRPIS